MLYSYITSIKKNRFTRKQVFFRGIQFQESLLKFVVVAVFLEIRNLLDDFLIAPLIMIPFVENAFKHSVDNSGHSVIDINIDIEDTTMIFCVKKNQIKTP
ncbi:MAG: hypothetical protein PHH37_11980 [Paludibacter sp.]|nr:hypothetical protein [Paludibacter sp.]